MRINRLGGPDRFQQILREVREVQRAAPLGRTSVTNGHTEFNGNESLLVNGSQKVAGWLIVTGTLKGVGTLLWEQVVNFTGAFTSTGPTKLNGPTEITSTLDVSATTKLRGQLELLADLIVKAGGKITVDGIDPMVLGLTSAGRPGIQFGTGAQVVGTANGAQLTNAAGNGFAYANDTVGLQRGSKSVEVTSDGVTVSAPFKVQSIPIAPAGTTVFAAVFDSAGNLYRKSTAA